VFSRAYINFTNPAHVFELKHKLDGHVFVSNKGNQYKCAVEYAPFQQVPPPNRKKDPREGTIQKGTPPAGLLISGRTPAYSALHALFSL
jgi:regulator of nonsense transcripts 3